MQSDHDYRTIRNRNRFKNHHYDEIQKPHDTQSQSIVKSRLLFKYTQKSVNGHIKFIPDFESIVTLLATVQAIKTV